MRNRRSRTSAMVFAATVVATAILPGAPAAARPGPAASGEPDGRAWSEYAAIGDSYSSGVGSGRYDLDGGSCLRSSRSYPALWAERHRVASFTFLACSGADAAQVRTTQVPRLPSTATFVTVTAGGNDAGFSPLLTLCTAAPADRDDVCSLAIAVSAARTVTLVPRRVGALITAVRHRAPGARVVVLGYPKLFERGPCHPGDAPSDARRARLNELADVLDTTLARTAAAAGASFVDVRATFAGHGVCAAPDQAWIHGRGNGAESYHPTADGYHRAYLTALQPLSSYPPPHP